MKIIKYLSEKGARKDDSFVPDDEPYSFGLQFAERGRLPRVVGLGCAYLPIASEMVLQPVGGGWWLLLLLWSFVWPHLAWQIALKAPDPKLAEIYNLKFDALLAGVWMAVIGFNIFPSVALGMMVSINTLGHGGVRLFSAGIALVATASLVMWQLADFPLNFHTSSLTLWMTLPALLIFPLLFSWVSYRTAKMMEEHRQRLQVLSIRDGMTGVYNRVHWEYRLRIEFEKCRREETEATLLLIDIDHFKSINDTWGHDIGDEAIIVVTRLLQTTLRASDVIGRFGGDEFAVIMCGTSPDQAIAAIERVHARLEAFRVPAFPQLMLSISVGAAPLTSRMSHYREWLKSADLALYKAKEAGRSRTEVAA